MTDKQINAAIAEVCGWTEIQNTTDGCYGLKSPTRGYIRIPDYCNDLNAMHEAEKVLMQNGNWRMGEYEARLFHSVEEMNNVSLYFHATARQRAEAFLRTLGKWEEVQQ